MHAIWDLTSIKRLSCTAHTLQLAISKGLDVVEGLVSHTKQLINFFPLKNKLNDWLKCKKILAMKNHYI